MRADRCWLADETRAHLTRFDLGPLLKEDAMLYAQNSEH
jgi:hypothetical protein